MTGEAHVRIAVLEEQIRGLREQQKVDTENTAKLFDKLFNEIDDLKAAMNRGRGVFAASLTFAGLVGAAATAAIEWAKK